MMYQKYSRGVIEVITGPMFSGKSEELIKRIKILNHANIKTLVVKPLIDKRWEKKKIISRAGSTVDTISIKNPKNIIKTFKKENYKAIAIDEAQFFNKELLNIIINFANKGIRVIISGLDQDYSGNPFGIMPNILAISDLIDKQVAVCAKCHNAATKTYRKTKTKKQVQIGDKEYEPRCRMCHLEKN